MGAQLEADRRDQLIEDLAHRLDSWRLTGPAIALLEAHKPLGFFASQTLLAFEPLLTMLLGDVAVEDYAALLEDRNGLERMISRLEEPQHQDRSRVR
jgi:hypothetical protein